MNLMAWAVITLLNTVQGANHFESVKTQVNPAIVSVFSMTARGTGFFITLNDTKFLVTAAHVCGNSPILVSARGLHRVLVARPDKDVCIATTWQGVDTLDIGDDPKNGDALIMNGFPGDLSYDVQAGVARDIGVSTFKFEKGYYGDAPCPPLSVEMKDGCKVFVTTFSADILARGGNSGGPIVGADGKLVGIIIGTDGGAIGVATPVSEMLGLFLGRP